jgi:uncharacterized protein YegP (UPF0339 family)
MGCFIISRTPSGDRFMLQSDAGRTLITSKDYATLDACKKGICSLAYYAPIVPIVDASVGEYGPNPKLEITAGEDGGLFYCLKSANGKSVVEDGPFATKKACLRAIAMLRAGVQGCEVFFARPGGFDRLTVGNMVQDAAPKAYTETQPPATEREKEAPLAQTETPPKEEPVSVAETAAPIAAVPTVKTVRRVQMQETPARRPAAPKPTTRPTAQKPAARPAAQKPAPKPPISKSLFSRLFKK